MLIRRTKARNCGTQAEADGVPSPYSLVYEAIVPKDYGFVADRGKRVGCIRIDDTGEGVTPYWSWVEKSYRRMGVGTKLYEAAARGSCKVFKMPLRSALKLSRQSRGFWEKQFKKGRADCEMHYGKYCVAFSLRCPAPESLAAPADLEPIIQDEERELVRWATERGALIDRDGSVVLRARGTKTRLRIQPYDFPRFRDRFFTHSHPPTKFKYRNKAGEISTFKTGASLSPQDGYMAAALDLAEMRAVTKVIVDGRERTVVYRIERPAGGWPPGWKVKARVDAAAHAHRIRLEHQLRRGEVQYEDVATAAADLGWKAAAPELGIKYDSVVLDGASSSDTNWWVVGGIALLALIPFV